MNVALVSSTAIGGNGATTQPIDTTGATLLLLSISTDGQSAGAAISDSQGNTWNPLANYANGGSVQFFYSYSKGTGPLSVSASHTVTAPTAYAFFVFTAWKNTIAFPSNPFEQEQGSQSGGTTSVQPAGAVIPANPGSLIVSSLAVPFGTGDATVDSGLAILYQSGIVSGVNFGGAFAYLVQPASAPIRPTWTVGASDDINCNIAVFRPALPPFTGTVSLVGHTRVSSAASSATTPPIDTTGANLLIGYISGYGSPNGTDPPTVSDNKGNSWIVLRTYGANNPSSAALYYCYLPVAVGPGHTVTMNSSNQSSFFAAFKGIKPAGGFLADTGLGIAATAVNIQPGAINVSAGDLLVTGVGHFDYAELPRIDSGFVILDETFPLDNNYYAGGIAYLIAPAAGPVDPLWFLRQPIGSGLVTSMAAFAAAAGAAPRQAMATIL